MSYLLDDMEKWAGDSGYDTKRILGELEGTRGNVKDAIADAKLTAQNVKSLYEKKKFAQAKADVLNRRHEINTNRMRHLDRLDIARSNLEGAGKTLRHEIMQPNPDLSRVEQWRNQARVYGKDYKELYDQDPKAYARQFSYDKAFSNSRRKTNAVDKELAQHKAQFDGSLSDLKRKSEEIKKLRAENQRQVERTRQNVEDGKRIRERLLEEQDRAKRKAEQHAMFVDSEKRWKEIDRENRKKGDRQTTIALAGTAAALGGGAYLYNRYKKKKREQAEQEKDKLKKKKAE